MDLSSMLNDGPAPEKKSSQASQPDVQHLEAPSVPSLVSGANRSRGSNQSTPLHGSSQAGGMLSRQSTGLTPLQTPSQGPGDPQYPFPKQPSQSPAASYPPGQQYQPYGPYSATTPSGRPPSHGFQYPQASPSQYQVQGLPPNIHAHQTSSLSPTPPSHHSQTPHSLRQSPLSVVPHGQQQYPLPPHHYQHSQPSTPLGPPPLHYQRPSYHSQVDTQSPYHQRTFSGTSNGITSGSPAQHQPSIGNLLDSPSAHNRHSPQLRRTSDYLSQQERERSLSVSPKTKVLPRAPSLGSRHSSQQELYVTSARSSLQHQSSGGVAHLVETPSHVPTSNQFSHHNQSQSVAQPPQIHSQQSHVAQHPSLPAQTPYPAAAYSASETSLSSTPLNNQQPQLAIQHQSQRMDMTHLLTPANSVVSMDGTGDATTPHAKQRKQQESSIFMKPSPKPKKPAVAPPPPHVKQQSGPDDRPDAAETVAVAQAGNQPQAHSSAPTDPIIIESPVTEQARAPESRKRPATGEPITEEPPAKRGRTRKYTERPIWARLARTNPRFNEQMIGVNGSNATNGANGVSQGRPQQAAKQKQPPRSNGVPTGTPAPSPQQHQQPPPQSNGHPVQPAGSNGEATPWLQNPPFDNDLIQARQIFGQWEKSICWNQPGIDIEKAVADWLYVQLAGLQDVNDPAECAIEIEAKIGRIMTKREGVRMKLPVKNAAVLDAEWARKETQFESRMEEPEHASMNKFLNEATKATMDKGRVKMDYKHPKEIDSFRPLSTAGSQALPAPIKRRPAAREMKLRTTIDQKSKQVTARIVKLHIADLHIYNPNYDYDCRITINLEANMNRPDLAPFEDLVMPLNHVDPTKRDSAPTPDRSKDRLSYKHLAYSIDLTRVDVKGLPAKYELELEVDAQVLREQMRMMSEHQGQPNGFANVVSGFLDNATYLMRQRPLA